MKKIVLLCSVFVVTNALAQPYYFYQQNENYQAFNDGTVANTGVWGGFSTINIPIGFAFNYMGSSFSSFDFESTGRIIFDANHYYFFDGIANQNLQDKGYPSSTSVSPISYKTEGSSGNQVFKLQVENATVSNQSGSTIDFQLWLYENEQRLELHMGPTSSLSAAQSLSGVYHVDDLNPINYVYGLSIEGDQNNPDDTTYAGGNVGSFFIDGYPNSGIIYVYDPNPLSIAAKGSLPQSLKVFPNPVKEWLTIENSSTVSALKIHNLLGEKVIEMNGFSNDRINVAALKSGIYLLSIIRENQNPEVIKFTKSGS